ncbi:MAG: 9-O-acetylesterase [Bacteroidaceae bacterium]|nr:9-O-acetylesterase [Bacteroidaceae bacterium]
MKKSIFLYSLLSIISSLTLAVSASVVLPGWMTSNMVLQQQTVVHLKATAKKGATVKITASWDNLTTKVQADKQTGAFDFDLRVPRAGGPYTLTFDDGQPLVLSNVMAGEVWFCSGQSNMQMPLHSNWASVQNWEQEVANANHPMVRLFQVDRVVAHTPQTEVPYGHTKGWAVSAPDMAEGFSAAAYFFAREVSDKLGVAVGVVNSSWGGTPAESWVSHDKLRGVTGFEDYLKRIEATDYDDAKLEQVFQEEHAAWQKRVFGDDKGLVDADYGRAVWAAVDFDDSQWQRMSQPARWSKTELTNWDGLVWFRRTIDIPADWAGKDLKLSLGEVDDSDVTYWNGEFVGATDGWNKKRLYTIPGRLVKAGRNVVTVRVYDASGEGGISGQAETLKVQNGAAELSLAGEWSYQKSMSANEIRSNREEEPRGPGDPWFPSNLYNSMVSPFLDMPIRGFLWYQGCSNVGRATQYESLFETLILDWQERFNRNAKVTPYPKPSPQQGERRRGFFGMQDSKVLPFYFVQIANYLARKDVQPESEWAALREAQRKALQLDGVGMAVNIDIGEANDIHPRNKQEVGRRLALLALNRTYGKELPCAAPEFYQMRVEGGRALLSFRPVWGSDALEDNDDIKGFIMAGPDHKWHVAKAHTEGERFMSRIVVECPEVSYPIAVRYAWADNPECNLKTKSGLPVGPFRTDDW